MKIKEFLKDNILILDGAMGTTLQAAGLAPGELPERWNLSHPDVIESVHRAYFDAGSNAVCTNTFGANPLKFDNAELEEIIRAGISIARSAAEKSSGRQEKFILLDIGPLGKLLKPFGQLDFEDAVSAFAEVVKLGDKYGADAICIETMNDSYETKAAVLAAKENSALPIFVTNAYGADGKLMTGATPEVMAALLEGLGVDAIGANCSLGPEQLMPVIKKLTETSSVPVIFKPNAGLPQSDGKNTTYDITPDEFSQTVAESLSLGVRAVGGCCGTSPEYISKLAKLIKDQKPLSIQQKHDTVVSSYAKAVVFGKRPVLIGERINPTGKKLIKQALTDGNTGYLLDLGLGQEELGADILDVNAGLPGIDERSVLTDLVCSLQAVTALPIQIDTSDPVAMESAMRRYNGKPLINSVNGKAESMEKIFPLIKKYGGVAVALTLDEDGIPATASGRYAIAEKILKKADEYGIDKKDIIFDTLTLTVSANPDAPRVTLDSLKMIREKLGCHTMLGVSNISFGLPCRDVINAVFFASALENGLSAAIMNPYSEQMMNTYRAHLALNMLDEGCAGYIAKLADSAKDAPKAPQDNSNRSLSELIEKGLGDKAGKKALELLANTQPLDIIRAEIIPALDKVGKGFGEQTVYLPQLLMSADAAKQAFEVIRAHEDGKKQTSSLKCQFVLATVRGDIHDIGKNIVKLLLENYGFEVIDLGRDVPPEKIVEETVRTHAPIVGLSALMTTTVPAMEETIKQLRKSAPWCKIVVGGAVMTEEYAKMIGADKYAADAMDTVRYAEAVAAR